MRKKLLLLSIGTLSAAIIHAADIKFGFTSEISGTEVSAPHLEAYNDGDNNTANDVSIEIARGSQATGSGKKDIYWNQTAYKFLGTCEKSQYGTAVTSAENTAVWTGAKVVVPTGYKLSVSKLEIDMAGNSYEWNYHVVVTNNDGDMMYQTSGSGNPQNTSLNVTSSDTYVLTGTSYVKVYYWFSTNSTTKYFAVPQLYLTGSVAMDVKTNYSKPVLTLGSYSQATATWPVTLAVQNGESGTITYQIGNAAEVTGVASGTVVNVAPNTTIKAKVTGSDYGDSQYQTLTTPDMPQLTTPTYTIGAYDLNKNVYTVTMATESGTLNYAINGGSVAVYSDALILAPATEVVVYASQENCRQSENLTFTIPAAPVGGSFVTPNDGGYVNNTDYNGGAFTLKGNYIAGNAGGNLNNYIKVRVSQSAGSHTGFRVNVNPGYTITSISAEMQNNYASTDAGGYIQCTGVYVDGSDDNILSTSVDIPNSDESLTKTVSVSDFEANNTIDFAFAPQSGKETTPNQARLKLTVSYKVTGTGTLGSVSGFEYGFATISAPRNFTISNATAYKAALVEKNGETEMKLTELEGVIPAGTGVIVAGVPSETFGIAYVAEEATADVSGNVLKGTVNRSQTTELAGGETIFAMQKSTATFKEYAGTYFPACRAYLVPEESMAAKAIPFFLVEDEEEATAVDAVEASETSVEAVKKYVKNGRFVIETAKGSYNAAGARVK